MNMALALARQAATADEVPVGAVLVLAGEVIGRGHNQPVSAHDSTAHAEIVALRQACRAQANYRLPGAVLYATVEPCMMCAGALVHARVARIVFGAHEAKAGVVSSHPLLQSAWLNHHVDVTAGVCAAECARLMSDFFARRRTAGVLAVPDAAAQDNVLPPIPTNTPTNMSTNNKG